MLWPRFTVALFKTMKDTSRKQKHSLLFCFCCFECWKNDRSPVYLNVHRVSVGWVMSQLSLAAEVVWLLDLTARIRPNSAVMSMAEEAGITHFKTLLQRWAHSVCCFRRTWGFQISAKSIQSHCSSPKVGVIVITRWIMNQAAPTASCSKYVWKSWLGALLKAVTAHTGESDVCTWACILSVHMHKRTVDTHFYFIVSHA